MKPPLDLNLLVVLDALLTRRHVSRAAEALGVGQPAASAALKRLRRHYSDVLLERSGNTHGLTPVREPNWLPGARTPFPKADG